MQQQVMVKKYGQKPDRPYYPAKVRSEAKKPLPATVHEINSMDMMGLMNILAEKEEHHITC